MVRGATSFSIQNSVGHFQSSKRIPVSAHFLSKVFRGRNMDKLVCVKDFEEAAEALLDRNTINYYKSGADDEITLRDNKNAFKRWMIRPKMLIDVSKRNTSTTVLGKQVAFPLGVSPSAMQKLAHPDGECANVRAAASMGTIYILSTISTTSLEDVAAAAPNGRKWFQLYAYKDRALTESLVKRAGKAGFEALVLTVDAPYFGRRRSNLRDGFGLPPHLRLANFPEGSKNANVMGKDRKSVFAFHDALLDQSLTWDDVKWLKRISNMPIIVKGILVPEDAELAVAHGVDGIMVSNHGARQIDTVFATIDALPAIAERVAGRCEIYLDGGVTTGNDVYKALALGANMVFAGRPLLWGLAVGGEQGAKKVLQIYRDEFDLTMALTGTPNVDAITRDCVARYGMVSHL